ncbi:hypothetical protein D3P04_21635 [Paracoccus onubensis]|uniref:HupE/UreJ family protein n=2 Tax=Paracoccus onubensis TaxID=1675788 RepID=A0A418SM61_9RHOB|nr:hypothetical protein D3P04_21635 [Paracoccus onubensis]
MTKSCRGQSAIATIFPYTISALAMANPALAHVDEGRAGWLHPLSGMDHMVAMIAVGAWSAQLGGRAVWLIPTVFVAFMAVGGVIGYELIDLPYTETGVALSVLLLGLAIALNQKMPAPFAAPAIAIFGISHGYLHGYEMPVESNKALYTAGFLSTTAALHILGLITVHFAIKSQPGKRAVRIAGMSAALFGIWLLI